jgi:hypothetical protein
MAALTITSRMSRFQLITGITLVARHRIQAVAALEQAPVYAGLEVMAQLAALHVRHSMAFERHAFLLKIERCDLPAGDTLDGALYLTADGVGQSSRTFAYRVATEESKGPPLQADLLIGTRTYDRQFKRDLLKTRYRELFDTLIRRGRFYTAPGQTQ